MKNATSETAARGFEIWLTLQGEAPTLTRVNAVLKREGREPIHQRSITHYENLFEHGLREYLPINQFDVRRSMGVL